MKIGDIIVPTSAVIDEGTSTHYISNNSPATASAGIVDQVQQYLHEKQIAYHHGTIWSSDAVYRETSEKVKYFQKRMRLR